MSSDVAELLSQKAKQVHVDVRKSNIRICVRMYTYEVVRKGLCVLAWEIGWCLYVFKGLIVLGYEETRENKFRNCSITVQL